MNSATKFVTVEEFLKLPETQPATELIKGEIIQKPMPQGEDSVLQGELCEAINRVTKPRKIAYAFPELRCTFGGDSIVPDIAVFRWERIPFSTSGRIVNRFEIHPDWAIEILSPDQSQTKVLKKLLHCCENGTELGWSIDPEEESILIVFGDRKVQLLEGNTKLPIIQGIDLELTVEQVFSWLRL